MMTTTAEDRVQAAIEKTLSHQREIQKQLAALPAWRQFSATHLDRVAELAAAERLLRVLRNSLPAQ